MQPTYMFHPKHGAQQFPSAEAAEAAKADGWADTPAGFESAPVADEKTNASGSAAEAAAKQLAAKDAEIAELKAEIEALRKATDEAEKLAQDKGVALTDVEGTGKGGAITTGDVKAASGKAAKKA